ncbi:MAG: Hsp33 family molecular chaperone HslO [Gammaproteobacteria bacterium]|nr:Hsp33 family molecular chaperone HslO [Gammaproteobacteria bacterium]
MSDSLTQFLIEQRGVRGAVVSIDSGLDAMFGGRNYSDDVRRLAGILLQRLPGPDDDRGLEDWAHVGLLLDTLRAEELGEVSAEQALRRLFHAEALRVFPPRPVMLACACSRPSISRMMLALGEAELEPELRANGRMIVTCEFCGRLYEYPEIAVRKLFIASRAPADGAVRH